MTKENDVNIGGMHVELFMPGENVAGNTVVIPELPHGSNIVNIVSGTEDLSDCDALMTRNHNLSLGIKTADCAPVCFSDGEKIGIAHIGWRGLCLGLIGKMLNEFEATSLSVYVAPFLHSFTIQKDFCYEQITQKFGERFITHQFGELIFRFKDAITSLLPPQTVYDSRNTASDPSFPSYRRNKTDKRFITVVRFQKSWKS